MLTENMQVISNYANMEPECAQYLSSMLYLPTLHQTIKFPNMVPEG